ncbi:AMP-binding domain-containing protein [Basidiobolus meristosporus CBS 931.73]|uniref:AMP-binding domain-containing protein n=1 Tax=Basidiobolus meristosporus CBS 931.73 TaxID=1314790 RepID=A0A1Y1YW72_9FUNG|nr:AMP-binding domain-containing protein [Basidiobolus meristosporus CBS 931.73]|eukprot:ORY02209.1 AMP-binding domain-containing protein [Basidiobolus meristosporus CBS 931.73]
MYSLYRTAYPRLNANRAWRTLLVGSKRQYSAVDAQQKQPKLLRHSHVVGDTSKPLCEDTIGAFWDRQVSKYGDREALVVKHENNLRWSFREFGENVDNLIRGLHASGLRKGDRVGVFMPNNSAWATLQYATAKLGLILVTINPAYRSHELLQALQLVECKSLILTPTFKTSNYVQMLESIIPGFKDGKQNNLECEEIPSLKQIIMVDNSFGSFDFNGLNGVTRYEDLLIKNTHLDSSIRKHQEQLGNNDIVNIQFTSGTTGLPKGVSLSHRNILNNGIAIGDRMLLTEKDKICIPVPLYHCFGLVLGNLAAMTHGASVVYPSEGFNSALTLKAVEEEKCTALHGVPTMFIDEMNLPDFDKYDLSSLRTGIAAGSPVPIETMKDLIAKMNMKDITICYGMTETSPVSFQSQTTDDVEHRCETVGSIHPHVEAKVIDPTTGETVPVGQSGELCTKGYIVMQGGYWNSATQTSEVIDKDGWMHTGDTGIIDEDGYCKIIGRIKDIIIRGGEKIHPVEVENCLFEMPGVQNVSIVGVPDKKFGEQVCAWITPREGTKLTEESVKAFCQGQISHYKIPKYVFFMPSDEFPKTVTGKIQKNIIRERSKEFLGL